MDRLNHDLLTGASVDATSTLRSNSIHVTPQRLTLVELSQQQIDTIAQTVPGGASNVQDIYPLTPLQEGMLFHHLLNETDTYVLSILLELESPEHVGPLIDALQKVIDRHDILRSAIRWEELPRPVQVVYRRALLPVEELTLDRSRGTLEQLKQRMRPQGQKFGLRQAPLVRLRVTAGSHGGRKVYALLQVHHLVSDHQSLRIVVAEVLACLEGREQELPAPVAYKKYVADVLANTLTDDAEAFFRSKLREVNEPTAPFGIFDVYADGSQSEEARQALDPELSRRLRAQARRLGVSAARMFHGAWGVVVARTTGLDDVVYGTVLLAAQQRRAQAQRMLGMSVNTLPLRLRLLDVTAKGLIEQTHHELIELLKYEQVPLTLAQRCSSVDSASPLFTSVLNFRHNVSANGVDAVSAAGVKLLARDDGWTNYPIALTIDDQGDDFSLRAQTDRRIDPHRIVAYLQTALLSLVKALEDAPQTPALELQILPPNEQDQVIASFNAPLKVYSDSKQLHELFEEQVKLNPNRVAAVCEGHSLTYAGLNGRANQLARYLRTRGIVSNQLVALSIEPGLDMVAGVLGILKAGAAYVPLDLRYPPERLQYMLQDAAASVLLTQTSLREKLPDISAQVIALNENWPEVAEHSPDNLDSVALGQQPHDLAYVIYTSGSTGKPKGVMVEHRNVTRLFSATQPWFTFNEQDVWTLFHSIAFDFSVWELWGALLHGGRIVVVPYLTSRAPQEFHRLLCKEGVTVLNQTPSAFVQLIDAQASSAEKHSLRVVIFGGEALQLRALSPWVERNGTENPILVNMYGITETTVHVTYHPLTREEIPSEGGSPIGCAIPDLRVYLLDRHRRPVPIGVAGEMYIGGGGVTRGYLNRPELTAARFIADPFSSNLGERLYKTGDLGRRRRDGSIEYLGRNDHQVKIRGFRIELGEIESAIVRHEQVKEVVVIAREDEPGEKRLVAYVVADGEAVSEAASSEVPEKMRTEIVSGWESVFKQTYESEMPDAGPSFVGWNSSYTGERIPETQMQEWLANTIGRIRALRPNRVLEIGCGVGLLLQHLAPACEVYVGTDFSTSALNQLGRWIDRREDLKHVELLHRAANNLQDMEARVFDTVVLNSVVQYFPDINYLMTVLQSAIRLLAPGGNIFVGDVRHLGLLATFHSAVQLSRAAASVNVRQLRDRIVRSVSQEKELAIDPQFFHALPGGLQGISSVDVQLKRGRAPNELTRYRYDVVIRRGDQTDATVACERLDWCAAVRSVAELEVGLCQRCWNVVRLQGIPNQRVTRELAGHRLIEESDERLEAGALRRQLSELQVEAVDPEAIWELAEAHGYNATVEPGEQGFFEVQLVDGKRAGKTQWATVQPRNKIEPWSTYANDPLESSLRQQLVPKLREYLKGMLPEYMIPAAWMVLKQLPLTTNGKVDRRALPAPHGRPEAIGEYVAPRNELERCLADIWVQVLPVDQVGIQDNFFELGGNSLLATRVISRTRELLKVELPIRSLFGAPTVEQLGKCIGELRRTDLDHPPLVPQMRGTSLPLSYAQERLWFLDQLGLVGAAYNMPMALKLEGDLHVLALEESLAELIRRHESLRTRFESVAGRPIQAVDSVSSFALEIVDLSALQGQDRTREARRRANDEAQRIFDLTKGPLLRASLLKLGQRDHLLFLTMHHIVSDGWSLEVLNRELSVLYGAYVQGNPSPLPKLPVQYTDYAIWQRNWLQGDLLQQQLQYWRERLRGAPAELQLPTDRPRPAVATFKGASFDFDLSAPVRGALEKLARHEGATLFMVVLAAYQVLLSRYSGQQDVLVGCSVAGRTHAQTEGLIGFFVNMLIMRADLSGNPSFRHLLRQVKEVTLGAYAHQDLPFEKLVKELRPERSLARQPIFQVGLAMHIFPLERLELTGLTWSRIEVEKVTSQFDVTLHLFEAAGGMRGYFEYATDLFDHQTIQRMAGHFRVLLDNILADPHCRIQQIQWLSGPEREQVLRGFNANAVSYPHRKLIHELFEEQANRTPEATAVVHDGQSLTYTELNTRANQLALHLNNLGVGPDQLVGLCVQRGVEMVVGVLGILKAGGAYVPLDPSYPTERLRYMLEDAAPTILLTLERVKRRLPETTAAVITLDKDWPEIARTVISTLDTRGSGLRSDNLAYVIYTSGSTGTPKGVMVKHGGLLNYLQWALYAYTPESGGSVAVSSSLAFDATVTSLYCPLLSGRSVVLLADGEELEGLEQLLQQPTEWSLIKISPAHLHALGLRLRSAKLPSRVGTFVIGGEALPPATVELWRLIWPQVRMINEYGPTETVVGCSVYDVPPDWAASNSVPIGRPISNTQIYILDQHQKPVPIGVSGEIFIGGEGVTRGYLKRPELTAERFVADPFSEKPQARMYRSGDLGRWRTDGLIEYLGRNDQQVKIRGYRIELGELEAQLARHRYVEDAVVVAREVTLGEKRLVAYVVGNRKAALEAASDESSDKLRSDVVGEWERLYEETYGTQSQTGPSFVGWNSSYDAQPIPQEQMQEWVTCTIERIRALRPNKVLEIGCGVGLLLQHLAPQCTVYVGADFSASALEQVRQWINRRRDLKHVELLRRAATELRDLQSGAFDTIILNSVAQYFPDIEYLLDVLQNAVRLLRPGGRIFMGDVRHLGLLTMFHSAVQLSKAAANVNVGQLKRRIARAVAQEKELVIAPQFFEDLIGRLRGISSVDVQLKRGRAPNELTRYRYDVVLHIGDRVGSCAMSELLEWQRDIRSTEELAAALKERRWCAARVSSIPDARLAKEMGAQRLIDASDENLDASALRQQLNDLPCHGVDPEMVWELGQAHNYDVTVYPGAQGYFDVLLLDCARADRVQWAQLQPSDDAKAWNTYANDPLESSFRQQLIPELRQYLKERLPEYMIPSAWMTLKHLPLTPNGKVDRRALPAPQSRPEEMGEYVAPRTDLERTLADIWAQVLRVDQVGVQDNFFELGGHSLLATQAVSKIRQEVGTSLALRTFFSNPTIASIADCLTSGATAPGLPGRILLRSSSIANNYSVCFPPTSLGLGTYFRGIAERLGTSANFYTCSLPGLLPGEEPLETIEEIAHHCFKQFTESAGYDEWSLVGYSFSGFVAYEIAQLMARAGFRVRRLILVDTYLPPADLLRQICNDERVLDRSFSKIVAAAGLDSGYNQEIALRMFKKDILAMQNYRPSIYKGSVIEIRAEQSVLELGQTIDASRPLPATPERVIILPGSHSSIMEESNRAKLATILDDALHIRQERPRNKNSDNDGALSSNVAAARANEASPAR